MDRSAQQWRTTERFRQPRRHVLLTGASRSPTVRRRFADRAMLDDVRHHEHRHGHSALVPQGRVGRMDRSRSSSETSSTPVSPVAAAAAGAWHQWGNAVMTVSLSSFASREGRRGARTWQQIQPILNDGRRTRAFRTARRTRSTRSRSATAAVWDGEAQRRGRAALECGSGRVARHDRQACFHDQPA